MRITDSTNGKLYDFAYFLKLKYLYDGYFVVEDELVNKKFMVLWYATEKSLYQLCNSWKT